VNVASGTYTVNVSLSGFKLLTRKGVTVSSGDRASVPSLVLEVGGLTEVVEVTAVAPMIQGQSGERSYTVTTEAVSNLPIASRSYIELASLAPGVQLGAPDPNSANSAGSFFPPMRLGGGSGVNDTITLDGAGIIDTGGANIRLAPNVDAISEVKVVASAYQAEYGRGSGIQIQGVTKSGTNHFRGSLYDVERQGSWNANTWVNQAAPTSCSSSSATSTGHAHPAVSSRSSGFRRPPSARATSRRAATPPARCSRISRTPPWDWRARRRTRLAATQTAACSARFPRPICIRSV
jgi:hypothetical protein